jgi:phosphoenolpyruvate-protein kinase (PTS system EI component)
VAYLYQPVHFAVLRLLRDATGAAHVSGSASAARWLPETRYAEILLGPGLDEVRVHAQLLKIKQVR